MASELIIQLQDSNGNFSCEKYDNFPASKSAYVAICFSNNIISERLANELKTKLIDSIINLSSHFLSSTPPCNENSTPFGRCQALSIPDNEKLLIVISDGASTNFVNPSVLQWADRILPVLEYNIPINLPIKFSTPNACFWKTSIAEVIPTLFGIIGISEEEQRIFISYKRSDTNEFAEHLFDSLNHEGFDVFLDRFSIEPGVNFQNRLYQELADKAMVIFLESEHFLKSTWIQLEIAFAKKYRLGYLALNVNNAPEIASIDKDNRLNITVDANGNLTSHTMAFLIQTIKEKHAKALYFKKHLLNSNVMSALSDVGAQPNYDTNGFICVANKTNTLEYKIKAIPRPAKVDDYYITDISNTNGERVLLSPNFIEEKRIDLNDWLSRKANVQFYNEGQVTDLAKLIY